MGTEPQFELTVLGSGSAGNATVVRYGSQALLVDAGFSGVELQRRLDAVGVKSDSLLAVLVSHEHDDHVQAVRVFCQRCGGLKAYANLLTAERLRLADKAPARMAVFSNGAPFRVGPFEIEAFSISHDAVDPVGFVIRGGGRQVGIATDFGHPGKMVALKLRDSDILVLESNHDPEMLLASRRPARTQHRIRGRRGHLSNVHSLELLQQVVGPRTRHLIMAHLSEECNHPELVAKLVRRQLQELGREDITLQVARQARPCRTVRA